MYLLFHMLLLPLLLQFTALFRVIPIYYTSSQDNCPLIQQKTSLGGAFSSPPQFLTQPQFLILITAFLFREV